MEQVQGPAGPLCREHHCADAVEPRVVHDDVIFVRALVIPDFRIFFHSLLVLEGATKK